MDYKGFLKGAPVSSVTEEASWALIPSPASIDAEMQDAVDQAVAFASPGLGRGHLSRGSGYTQATLKLSNSSSSIIASFQSSDGRKLKTFFFPAIRMECCHFQGKYALPL